MTLTTLRTALAGALALTVPRPARVRATADTVRVDFTLAPAAAQLMAEVMTTGLEARAMRPRDATARTRSDAPRRDRPPTDREGYDRIDDPVAITTEVAPAPWRSEHRLVRIALQARPIETAALPPSNLVFLVDVSGSLNEESKLPLVQRALRLLVDELRPQDRIALVAYAGSAGLVLPPTGGHEKARIAEAIDRLEAGGSTAGGKGCCSPTAGRASTACLTASIA